MEAPFYALFLQTGEPIFYLLAKREAPDSGDTAQR